MMITIKHDFRRRRKPLGKTGTLSLSALMAFIVTGNISKALSNLSSSFQHNYKLAYHNDFQLYSPAEVASGLQVALNQSSTLGMGQQQAASSSSASTSMPSNQQQQAISQTDQAISTTTTTTIPNQQQQQQQQPSALGNCQTGLLTFELSTGFIYKPSAPETLAMMPGTLQLTDCLENCRQNASCLAINFEMGLCVLLSSSARQNLNNLYSSQFPVFTIYAEKKCLLLGDLQANKQLRRCQRAWTFERVAGYEMKTKPRKRLKLASKEQCMEACLIEREFECRSANWFRQPMECTLSDQDRHSVSQSEAGDQQIKSSLHDLYGPSDLVMPPPVEPSTSGGTVKPLVPSIRPTLPPSLYQNYYLNLEALLKESANASRFNEINIQRSTQQPVDQLEQLGKYRKIRQLFSDIRHKIAASSTNKLNKQSIDNLAARNNINDDQSSHSSWPASWAASSMQYMADKLLPANAVVDYLENNCVYEPNKLCEFRKIQNRVLKTVDSIYQDVGSLEECKQKCLNAPYRCYSFDYGDTSERVCRTSHLDQASLLSVKEPYLDVMGAITYELASCFNVSIQCKAREMVALVSSSKTFRGKIYVKSRPTSCVNDVRESLKFELSMKYNDDLCDVQSSSNNQQGVFSNDIIIQHHDRILTTQDVGLSVYCQYDLGNRSITNNVDLAIEKIDESPQIESQTKPNSPNSNHHQDPSSSSQAGYANSPLTITNLATTVVKSPNVTMRIMNMLGQPVSSASVGDRLALLFEIKEKTSPFGIFVREIIAMDGKQLMLQQQLLQANNKFNNNASNNNNKGYHYANSFPTANQSSNGGPGGSGSVSDQLAAIDESSIESMLQANRGNSVQFIDADGCPTDANIMGPLVKMDSSGHRILAPFDAFKFPTSDMVFFRAVVSSCVSECKPAVCPASGTQAATAPLGLMNTDTTVLSDLAGLATTPTQTITLPDRARFSSTTSAPAKASESFEPTISSSSQQMPTSISYMSSPYAGQLATTLTRWANNTPSESMLAELLRNKTRPTTPLPAPSHPQTMRNPSSNTGDLLTTVAGFSTTTQAPPPPTTTARVSNPEENQVLDYNATTNNHQFGKPPPRPVTSGSTVSAINLDHLSQQQKQQLVKLFESKLKQHFAGANAPPSSTLSTLGNNIGGGLSEMADLYTGFLTSVLLKTEQQRNRQQQQLESAGASNSDAQANNYKRQQAEQLVSQASSTQLISATNGDNDDRHPSQSEHLSSRQQQQLEAFLSQLLAEQQQQMRDRNANRSNVIAAAADNGGAIFRLSEQQQSNGGFNLIQNPSPEGGQLDQHQRQLNDNVNKLQTETGDSSSIVGRPTYYEKADPLTAASSASASATASASASANDQSNNNRNNNTTNVNQQPIQPNTYSSSSSSSPSSSRPSSTAANNNGNKVANHSELQRKRMKQQAFADSYLGAFHSFGKRRRKRDSTLNGSDGNSPETNVLDGHEYVYSEEQPQFSEPNGHFRFTKALIEVYQASSSSMPKNHFQLHQVGSLGISRAKRDAPVKVEEPVYETDELIIQSIKILDRPQVKPSKELHKPETRQRQQTPSINSINHSGTNQEPRSQPSSIVREHIDWLGDGGVVEGEEVRLRMVSWTSSSGALTVVVLAILFIFAQVFLVVVYFFDLNRRQAIRERFMSTTNRLFMIKQHNQHHRDQQQQQLRHAHSTSTLNSSSDYASSPISSISRNSSLSLSGQESLRIACQTNGCLLWTPTANSFNNGSTGGRKALKYPSQVSRPAHNCFRPTLPAPQETGWTQIR